MLFYIICIELALMDMLINYYCIFQLRIPILYLASKTNRSSFNEMIEDVFQFARDRYFVGEMVEASFTEESWCDCHVLQVIVPSEQQIKTYLNENGR